MRTRRRELCILDSLPGVPGSTSRSADVRTRFASKGAWPSEVKEFLLRFPPFRSGTSGSAFGWTKLPIAKNQSAPNRFGKCQTMSRSPVRLPPVPMGAVTIAAFRISGFVVPIHVKKNRTDSVETRFAGPTWRSMASKAPWSGRPAGRMGLNTSILSNRTADSERVSREKTSAFAHRHNAP
jgi:hypothetical protein